MKDERIEQALNKIRSEMAVIILYGVGVSFLIKTLIWHMKIQECITEYLILIVFPLYQLVRMHMLKISITSVRGNKGVKNMIITLALLAAVFILYILDAQNRTTAHNWRHQAIFLLIYLAAFVGLSFLTKKINQIRAHQYAKEFDDDK